MSWQEFKYVWGFEERPHIDVIHEVNTCDGVLAAGNLVYDGGHNRTHEYFVVNLPPAMDFEDKLYAQYLLDHPHPRVIVNFDKQELWQGEEPIIIPLNYGEKSPKEMTEEEYQEWLDEKRGVRC